MKKVKLGSLIYYIIFGFYCFCYALQNSMILHNSPIVPVLTFICRTMVILGTGLKFMLKRWNTKYSILVFAVFLFVGVVVYFRSNTAHPIMMLLLMISARDCNPRTIAITFLIAAGSVVALAMAGSAAGLVEDRLFYRSLSGTIKVRHSWGMDYVTILAGYLFFFVATLVYLSNKPLNIWICAFIVIVGLFMFYTMDARMEVGALLIVIVQLLLMRFYEKNMVIRKILVYSAIIFGIISFITIALYMKDPSKYNLLNLLLSNRLKYTSNVLKEHGYSLFGDAVRMQGWGTVNFDTQYGYYFIDSAYLNYAVRYGLIFVAVLCGSATYIHSRIDKKQCVKLLSLLTISALHGMFISSCFMPYMNPLYLIAVAEISAKSSDEFLVAGG